MMDEVREMFLQECEDGLAEAERGLAELEQGAASAETLNAVFRAVHSIKGGAGIFGFDALVRFAHRLENVLDDLRAGRLAVTPELVSLLLVSRDRLADHVECARTGSAAPDDAALMERLAAAGSEAQAPAEVLPPAPVNAAPEADEFGFTPVMATLPGDGPDEFGFTPLMATIEEAAPLGSVASAPWILRFEPRREALQNGGEPLLYLRELTRLGGRLRAVETERLPALGAIEHDGSYCAWVMELPGTLSEEEIRDVFEFISDICTLDLSRDTDSDMAAAPDEESAVTVALLPEPASPADAAQPESRDGDAAGSAAAPAAAAGDGKTGGVAATLRVDLSKVDHLVNLVGELVIQQAILAQNVHDPNSDPRGSLDGLAQLTREMQDAVMSMRAQPVRNVFSRVPRLLRELEAQTGKRVRLELSGEATEVDKTVVDGIGEPLTHLIRNAVDHGIETPADRIAAGKSPEGVLRLAAEHRGSRIIISVSDDGQGINRKKVLAKAIERGIVSPGANLSDEEIDGLIFAPGFSTAETVSNISGRGVGMDVVKKNIQALGGRVSILSQPGHGTSFNLTLPLTLAVMDGIVVRVGRQTYVIPLGSIVENIMPTARDLHHVGTDAMLLEVRGAYLPVVDLGRIFGIDVAARDPLQAVMVIVECEDGPPVALVVDAIQDQRQIVIKSLESNFRAVEGVAGATILGDGRVALIVDVDAVGQMARRGWGRTRLTPIEIAA